MATIQNVKTDESCILNVRHTFGRYMDCSTVIPNDDISRSHATISWEGGGNWHITDHSKNGTLFNGEYLHNTSRRLSIGNWFQLGKNNDSKWRIINLEEPFSYIQLEKELNRVVKLRPSVILPDEEHPQVIIDCDESLNWWKTEKNSTVQLKRGDKIVIGTDTWIFVQNDTISETEDLLSISKDLILIINLSADEEHIHMQLEDEHKGIIDLSKRPRSYDFLVLTLARKRLEDFKLGYSQADQGWIHVDELSRIISKEIMKEIDFFYINLLIHRFRKKLVEIPDIANDSVQIIQRRPGTGYIRLEYARFRILKDGICIGQILENFEKE